MEQGTYGILNGAVKCPRRNIDFLVPFALNAPSIIQRIMTIAATAALNGDCLLYTSVTQKYIGIQQKELERAIENHLCLDI